MVAARRFASYAVLAAVLALGAAPGAHAQRTTVCSITINSPDEREVLRRHLPGEVEVVELVERGHSDWLASACHRGVRCDALVISGHFDGGVEFYADRLDQRESLPMADLEQAACSASCASLFAGIKEVYLFGCNTLDAVRASSVADEVERSLLRAGRSAEAAKAAADHVSDRVASSNRDRMRALFRDVPVVYGFPGKAPLGHAAGPLLTAHLRSGEAGAMASGRANAKLLRRFAGASMTWVPGIGDADPLASHRRDLCAFVDPGQPLAERVAFLHRVLERDIAEVRALLDRLEALRAALPAPADRSPALVAALQAIAADSATRERFLAYARDVDVPQTRRRMLDLAHGLAWLSDAAHRAELRALVAARLAAGADAADVELACELNRDGRLAADRAPPGDAGRNDGTRAAMLACLGDDSERQRLLAALAEPREADVAAAEVLLRHRPPRDAGEVRAIAAHATRAPSADLAARMLHMLAPHARFDAPAFATLAALFRSTRSLAVQRAIATLWFRVDAAAAEGAAFASVLRAHRLPSDGGRDVIDVVIRRLEAAS